MPDVKYEIIKNIGVLSESSKGWTKKLNLISWNGREPKYDIRDWDPEHEKMGKGVTLTEDELKRLSELFKSEKMVNYDTLVLKKLTSVKSGRTKPQTLQIG